MSLAVSSSRFSSCNNVLTVKLAASPQGVALATAAAFNCAAAVYKRGPKVLLDADPLSPGLQSQHRDPRTDGVEFKEIQYGPESFLGTTKAIGIWRADSVLPCEELPALIIACRGTESILDKVVNANGRSHLLADLLVRFTFFRLSRQLRLAINKYISVADCQTSRAARQRHERSHGPRRIPQQCHETLSFGSTSTQPGEQIHRAPPCYLHRAFRRRGRGEPSVLEIAA